MQRHPRPVRRDPRQTRRVAAGRPPALRERSRRVDRATQPAGHRHRTPATTQPRPPDQPPQTAHGASDGRRRSQDRPQPQATSTDEHQQDREPHGGDQASTRRRRQGRRPGRASDAAIRHSCAPTSATSEHTPRASACDIHAGSRSAVLDPGADRVEHPGGLRQRRAGHHQHVGHLTRRGLVQVPDDPRPGRRTARRSVASSRSTLAAASSLLLRLEEAEPLVQRSDPTHRASRPASTRTVARRRPPRGSWSPTPRASSGTAARRPGPPATSRAPAEAGPARSSCTVGSVSARPAGYTAPSTAGADGPISRATRRSASARSPSPSHPTARRRRDLDARRDAVVHQATAWSLDAFEPTLDGRETRAGARTSDARSDHATFRKSPFSSMYAVAVILLELHRPERHTLRRLRQHRLHLGRRSSPTSSASAFFASGSASTTSTDHTGRPVSGSVAWTGFSLVDRS